MKTLLMLVMIIGLIAIPGLCLAEEWYEREERSANDYTVSADKVVREESDAGRYSPHEDVRKEAMENIRIEQDVRAASAVTPVAPSPTAAAGSTRLVSRGSSVAGGASFNPNK